MSVPTNLISLTTRIFFQVHPAAHRQISIWKDLAGKIPDPELRGQAQMSIATKTFHCEGGSIYGLLAGKYYKDAIKFIVAYQTISDYLDNLCDRSTSLNPDDFRALHEAMLHALTPDAQPSSYYRFRKEQDDGGYLVALVTACQDVLRNLPAYHLAAPHLHALAGLYCDLQVYKHVAKEDRVELLQQWFETKKDYLSDKMTWYEFAACTGSTLGVFCLVSSLFCPKISGKLLLKIKKAYFPWLQGMHILLDYLIDQEEDRNAGDLNFCDFYPDNLILTARLITFYKNAQQSVSSLPHRGFHRLIIRGLLGIYLSDKKTSGQKDVLQISRKLLRLGGLKTIFFYLHCRAYRHFK
ncbi:MAG TPA: tetraprenyl-beta-curcumene synthase family protein [Deltaproteobacteria bacterium]|nr:tetraprenyl-beta-curcumene synthase family protein [Deltaproteobacteria bacterium]